MGQSRNLEQFISRIAVNDGHVLPALGADRSWQDIRASLSVFLYSEWDPHILHLFLHVFRERNISLWLSNEASFLQAASETVTLRLASKYFLSWSGNSVLTAYHSLTLPQAFLFTIPLIKKESVSDHIVPANGNTISIVVLTVTRAFKVFENATALGSVA